MTLTIPTVTHAQIPLLNANNNSESQFTPVWKLGKTRVCGKYRCSNVNFPYFPYASISNHLIDIGNSFTIASRTNLENPQTTANELEIRANSIERTWLSIYKKTIKNFDIISLDNEQDKFSLKNIKRQNWLPYQEKSLHPLTPRVEVGIKNNQTVIFVPAQEELNLSTETIVTVTDDDSVYNGQPIDTLASQWRSMIQSDLSEALWGYEFDRRYPWGRLGIVSFILFVAVIIIILMTVISYFIRQLNYQLKRKINELNELAKQQQQDSVFNISDGDNRVVESNLAREEDRVISLDKQPNDVRREKITDNFNTNFQKSKLPFIQTIQEFVFIKTQNLTSRLPKNSLAYQNALKQLKNLTVFCRQLLFWLRIFILFIALSLVVSVYPNTRQGSFFFLVQAIFLPLIWMLVNLGDTIASFFIDYYLNRWAREAQITDPNSNRYTLRVTTYSPALKGASRFVFSLLGIFLTIQLIGIDPSVLAGAGGAALLIGFLVRNVLEDMLNGILILWTDRYAIGDIITVGSVGGFVENMNLYTTQVRGTEGCLITIPNGQITLVQNKTKDWSRVEFTIEISVNSDPVKALQLLQEIGEQLQTEPDWHDLILEPVSILGIDAISDRGVLIQVRIKTQPMKQWLVGREYRLRVLQKFKQEKIELGIPQRQIWHKEEPSFENN